MLILPPPTKNEKINSVIIWILFNCVMKKEMVKCLLDPGEVMLYLFEIANYDLQVQKSLDLAALLLRKKHLWTTC